MSKANQIDTDEWFDLGGDLENYDCWFQDPNYRPDLVSKSEMAELAGVSLKTIDDWIRKGAPVHRRGRNGVSYQIAVTPFLEWHRARLMGVSIKGIPARVIAGSSTTQGKPKVMPIWEWAWGVPI